MRRTREDLVALAIFALAALLLAACESEGEREAREQRERSERELARLLETGVCVGCNIREANLEGRDLRGIELKDSVLHGNLRRADLRGAHIVDSSLSGDLRELDLRGAKTEELDLSPGAGLLAGARLDELDLRSARFTWITDWRAVVMPGANLARVRFGVWDGPRRRMKVPRGCLTGADLRRANLADSDLLLTDLRDADLREANLRGASLPRLEHLYGAKLEGAVSPNGEICISPSVGSCRSEKHVQPPWRWR